MVVIYLRYIYVVNANKFCQSKYKISLYQFEIFIFLKHDRPIQTIKVWTNVLNSSQRYHITKEEVQYYFEFKLTTVLMTEM